MASPNESARQREESFPTIPGYRIEGVLGRGATGVVYRATQIAVDRPVALKILRSELVGTKRAVRRLQREARTAARLAHPSIISAIDMGEVGGVWWYAMELVEGQPLSDRIAERGQLSEREALRLFSPLCDALQHAYEQGVVHRDIKPANILIDGHGRARLVDLGLAFAEGDPLITRPGGTLGTPHFISPEQARDPSGADTRSDIWSLGATLYHALCGRPPFEREGSKGSVAEILSSVLYQPIPDPQQLAPHLSRGISFVVRKCLNRDPERRYQVPAELTRDLERLRERRAPEIRSGALDPVARGDRLWQNSKLRVAFGVVLGVGVLGLALLGPRWGLWGAGPIPSVDGGEPESWPEIEQVGRHFKGGQMQHQSALFALEQMRVPERFEVSLSKVKTVIFSDLDRALGEMHTGLKASLRQRVEVHDWVGAQALIDDGVERVLATSTGFAKVADLPAGRRKGTELWVAALSRDLEQAFGAALEESREALRRHYVSVVRARARRLGEARQWRDALALIDTPPLRWLETVDADLRGFDTRALAKIEESVFVECNADRKDLRNAWLDVAGDLNRWIEGAHETLRGKLDSGDVRAAGANLRDAFEARLLRERVVREQVPEAWDQRPFLRAEAAARDLEQREATLLQAFARSSHADDLALTRELCRRRNYAAALKHWRQREADPLFDSLGSEIQLRVRECELLQGVLQRAVEGVERRRGQAFECYVGNILERGTVRLAPELAGRGFELETRQRRVPVFLVAPVEEKLPAGATVLRCADIEILAGLAGAQLEAEERLLRALLRYYEGDLAGAQDALPLGALSGEPLVESLDKRIRHARDAESARGEAREGDLADRLRTIKWSFERSQYVLNPRKLQEDIEAVRDNFGDILTDDVRDDLRAILEAVQLSLSGPTIEDAFGPFEAGDLVRRAPRGLEMRFRFDGKRAGAWIPGAWGPGEDGWVRSEAIATDDAFLRVSAAARLILADPFDAHERIKLELTLDPLWSAATANTLLVSVAGVHVVFLDDPASPRVLAGTGDAARVLEQVKAGDTPGFGGFAGLPDDHGYSIEISVHPSVGRLDYVRVDGVDLTIRTQFNPSASREAEIAVRSMAPVRLVGARLEGRRQR